MDHTTLAMSDRTADGMVMGGAVMVAFVIVVSVMLISDALRRKKVTTVAAYALVALITIGCVWVNIEIIRWAA